MDSETAAAHRGVSQRGVVFGSQRQLVKNSGDVFELVPMVEAANVVSVSTRSILDHGELTVGLDSQEGVEDVTTLNFIKSGTPRKPR